MTPEEIESIRRSLAMSPTLTAPTAQTLLAEVVRLRAVVDDVYETVSQALSARPR